MPLRIVAGLGNPGAEYARTPHNVGFQVVDQLAAQVSASWREESRFQGAVARARISGVDALLLKPLTYMNLSGESVARLMQYFGVGADGLLVVSDDADLPVGRLRVKPNGSAGGHRGLQSIIDHIGTNAFARVRVGIGRASRGGSLASYVLSRLAPDDEAVLQEAIGKAAEAAVSVLAHGVPATMNQFNGVGAPNEAPAQKDNERG